MRLAIATMFELWSLCEAASRERVPLEGRPLEASIVRGPDVRRRRRTAAGPGAARAVGAAPARPGRRVARSRRGAAVVDAEQRVLRQRGDAHGSAQLPVGWHAAARAARPAT